MTLELVNSPGQTLLDPDEQVGLKHPSITTREELNQLEQSNIQDGMVWLSRTKTIDILSDHFVRTLHEKLFGNVWKWAGKYKLHETNIGVAPYQVTVAIRDLLEDVRYWIAQKTFPPIEIAARLHHRLTNIHPFPNGNGRFSRIMADVVLTKLLNEPAIVWGKGDDLRVQNKERKQYCAALTAADAGDYAPLFKFIGYTPK